MHKKKLSIWAICSSERHAPFQKSFCILPMLKCHISKTACRQSLTFFSPTFCQLLEYEFKIYWLVLFTLMLRTTYPVWPDLLIQKPISDMAGKRCQEKSARVGKFYEGSSECFPGHSPRSRHKWQASRASHTTSVEKNI